MFLFLGFINEQTDITTEIGNGENNPEFHPIDAVPMVGIFLTWYG